MKYLYNLSVICLLLFAVNSFAQGNKFELNISAAYNNPLLEAYGNGVDIDLINEIITVDGKNLVNSDNFGTTFGFGIQLNGGMRLLKSDYLRLLVNIGYSQLESKKTKFDSDSYGVRLNIFSLGAGLQVNPVGIHKFYPSVTGLFRFNEIGGESFYHAGGEFLIVSPRFGVTTGLDLNYKFNKKVALTLGVKYNYDNMLNKQSSDEIYKDDHVVSFRDKQSVANGLSHDRRVAYLSIATGINIYFK